MWIVQNVNWMGYPGWRWIYALAGIPAIILGIITFFFLDDKPEQAKWLSKEEKEWLTSELEREEANKVKVKGLSIKDVFRNKLVWRFTFTNTTFVIGMYGISFFMPRIIKSLSSLYTNTQIGLITMIPYFCGALAMVLIGKSSDRTGERKYHAAFGPFLGTIGLLGVVMSPSPIFSIIAICIATCGLYSFSGPYWTLTTSMITAEVAVVGTGIINSVGNLGGFVGPYAMGYLIDTTGNINNGVAFLAIMLGLTCIQVLLLGKRQTATEVVDNEVVNN